VNALKVKTTPVEMSIAGAHPTENVAAYDIYLRGRQSLRGQQDPKNIQAAIDLFEQAIKMDSGFALAYTGLSDASMLMYREKKDRFWSERGIAVAKQAERLNAKLARGTSLTGKRVQRNRANHGSDHGIEESTGAFAEFG